MSPFSLKIVQIHQRAKMRDIDPFLSFTVRARPFSEREAKIEGFDPTMVLTHFRAGENCAKFNFN